MAARVCAVSFYQAEARPREKLNTTFLRIRGLPSERWSSRRELMHLPGPLHLPGAWQVPLA